MSNIVLKNVRLSFPSLFNRSMFQGTEGKFEATFLIPKEDKATIDTINKAIAALYAENKIKVPLTADKVCFKDGNTISNKDGDVMDGYQGCMSFKAASNKPVQIVNRDKSPITEEQNIIYAGCYVNAVVGLWWQSNAYGKRVNGNLMAVQFVKDGDNFGSSSFDADSAFDDLDGSSLSDL